MPFSVSGELCMVRKAVRHALIMALETFTIDDKKLLELVKISGYSEHVSVFYRCCRWSLPPRAQSYYSNAAPVCCQWPVRGRRHRQPARGKQKHRRTNETDINDS